MTSRTLVGLLVVWLGVSLTVASGGFSAAEVDRNATVDVADDPDALVGVETHDIERTKHTYPDGIETGGEVGTDTPEAGVAVLFVYEDVPIGTVTNRFPAPMTVNVTVETEDEYPIVEGHRTPTELGVGESGDVTVDVKCPVVLTAVGNGTLGVSALDTRETTAELDIGADSPATRTTARLTREATVECSFPGARIRAGILPDDTAPGLHLDVAGNTSHDPTPVLED